LLLSSSIPGALCFELECYAQGRLVWTGCRAVALPEKCKAKDSAKRPNSPKFGFRYENFTTQSFSVLPTPFWLNVSEESNKTNASLFSNDAAYAMTFSAHLPMNLAISGLSSAQP